MLRLTLSKRYLRYKYVSIVVIFLVVVLEIALYFHLSKVSLRPLQLMPSLASLIRHTGAYDSGDLPIIQRSNDGTGLRPTFVLILAYYRTGSSLLGELFNEDNRTFYSYEPLYSINTDPSLSAIMKVDGEAPRYLQKREPEIVTMTSESISIMEAIFTCRLHLFHEHYLLSAFALKSPSFGFLYRCIFITRTDEVNSSKCMDQYVKMCQSKTIRVIKSIRIRMSTVEYFLKKYPNFKVVHLIRDPRGTLCSIDCANAAWKWEKHCQRVEDDITTRSRLTEKFPDQLHEVVYEKFVLNPIAVSKEIYNFVGKTLPYDSTKWLFDKTMAGNPSNGISGTTRPDSVKVAYNWTSKIKNYHINYANRVCSAVIRHGNFIPAQSTNDLVNFTLPKRPN